MATLYPYLLELLELATAGLPGVHKKRMFGCDALFVHDEIFALVWKTGRIGVKLTDPGDYLVMLDLPGAAPWHAGTKAMSHWVLAPEPMHDDLHELTPWIRRAHAQAIARAAATGPVRRPSLRLTGKPAARPARPAKPAR